MNDSVVDIFFIGDYVNLSKDKCFRSIKKQHNIKNIYIVCDNYDLHYGEFENFDLLQKNIFDENEYLKILKLTILNSFRNIANKVNDEQFDKILGINTFELTKDDLISDNYEKAKKIYSYDLIFKKHHIDNDVIIIIGNYKREHESITISSFIKNFDVKIIFSENGEKIKKNIIKNFFKDSYLKFLGKLKMLNFYIRQITPHTK